MYKININNNEVARFEDIFYANEWINENRPFSYNDDRWLYETDGSHTEESYDSDGVVIYFFPQDYSYEIIDLLIDPEWIAQKRLDDRKAAYNRDGVTQEALLEALVEHIKENRPDKLNALQLKRNKVKLEIP